MRSKPTYIILSFAVGLILLNIQASTANPADSELKPSPDTLEHLPYSTDSLHHIVDSLKTENGSLEIGVALSGGGARGLAHIGVLQVLKEQGVEIDYITGTSMGSIIGGFYAMGYSPDYMANLVQKLDWTRLFSEKIERSRLAMIERLLNERFLISLPIDREGIHLPEGLITGQNILTLLTRLSWPYHSTSDFSTLPVPYAATATNLANGDLVVLDSGYLPDAMRASMAIPSIFTPYKVNGKLLIDGGFVRSIPATEVRDMGADYVISVDVTKPLKPADSLTSITSIMNQVLNFRNRELYHHQLEISDLVLSPPTDQYSISDFDKAKELIRIGRNTATNFLKFFRILADSGSVVNAANVESHREGNNALNPRANSRRLKNPPDSINTQNTNPPNYATQPNDEKSEIPVAASIKNMQENQNYTRPGNLTSYPSLNERIISEIHIEGLQELSREHILNEFKIPLDQPIGPKQIDEAVNQLFSTRFFDLVTYRTEPTGKDSYKLILQVQERDQDQFKLGFRYDTDSQASLLSQFSFRNLLHKGSLIRLQAQLGDITSISGEYTLFRGIRPQTGIRTLVNYQRENINWYRDGKQVSSFTNHHLNTELTTGTYFSDQLLIAGGLSKDWVNTTGVIGAENLPFARKRNHHSIIGQLWFDTLNRLTFPTRGQTLLAEFTYSDNLFYSPLSFTRQHFYWSQAIPLFRGVTLQPELRLGRSTGSQIPASQWFYLQRMDPKVGYLRFAGYHDREVHGRNLQMAGLGVQIRVGNNKYVRLYSQGGNTFSEWPWDPWNYPFKRGYGLSVGGLTFAGPIELSLSSSKRHPLLIFFQIGYPF